MRTDETFMEKSDESRQRFPRKAQRRATLETPQGLKQVGVLLEPKKRCAGSCQHSQRRAMIQVTADRINLELVLGNEVMVGTVNAKRECFEMGVRDMAQAEAEYPRWLCPLLTDPVRGWKTSQNCSRD
jgi:hypothetical protein